MRAMSLDASGKAEEDNELSNIKIRLEFTNNLVASLSKQLDELNERVSIFIKCFFSTAFPLKYFMETCKFCGIQLSLYSF
jgi:hypothetical protein